MIPRPPVAEAPLRDAHETERLSTYVRHLARRRSYMWYVSTNNLRSRHMTSVLGNFWHLLNPMLSIAVYYLVFGVFLSITRSENYVLFVTVGVLIYGDSQRATIAGANSIVNNRGLLQALRFPRALLPISSTLTESLASAPGLLVIYLVALLEGVGPRATWVLLPLLAAAQFIFNTGLALIAARVTTIFRDTAQILPFVFRLMVYTSGVIFAIDSVQGAEEYRWLFNLNPLYCFISIARWTISGGEFENIWLLTTSITTVTAIVFGLQFFRSAEETYGRD